jgi:hypothetical protein
VTAPIGCNLQRVSVTWLTDAGRAYIYIINAVGIVRLV